MKKKKLLVGSLFLPATVFVACAPPSGNQNVQYVNPQTSKPMTLALEYKDFQRAALKLVQKMLKSGVLNHPNGGRYVIAIATIKNDTTQRIDVDQLLSDIKEALLESGKVVISSAVSTTDQEKMLQEIRKLRGNKEFNQATLPGKGQLIAPDYLLAGKIIERDYYMGDKKYVEYYFILKLIDTKTGLIYWEGKEVIGKAAGDNASTW
jgi:uncharacterized protein (TIGR02722 family)